MRIYQIAERVRVYCDFLKGTDFLKSFYYNMIKSSIKRPNRGLLLIGKDAAINIHKDGCIVVLGKWAKIGYGNVKNNGRKASVEIWKKGKLILEQDSLIYQDADITILEDAVLRLGVDSIINRRDTIVVSEKISIGDGCRLAPGVTIRDAMGQTLDGVRVCKPVEIEEHVWLCTNATILPGVRIGKGSIVAAHAVLKDSLPEKVMVAGVPAKIKKTNVVWGYPIKIWRANISLVRKNEGKIVFKDNKDWSAIEWAFASVKHKSVSNNSKTRGSTRSAIAVWYCHFTFILYSHL